MFALPANQRRLQGSFRVFHFRHNLAKGDEADEDMYVEVGCVEETCEDSRCNIFKVTVRKSSFCRTSAPIFRKRLNACTLVLSDIVEV